MVRNKHDIKHWQNVLAYMRGTNTAFSASIARIIRLYDRIPTDTPLDISKYPWLKQGIDAELKRLATEIYGGVLNGIDNEWTLSNVKNDAMAAKLIGTRNVPNALMDRWMGRNLDSLQAFKGRFGAGKDLSTRVWGIVKGHAVQMEQAMALGIYEGTPAAKLAGEMRQYLNNPNALFRRVRDAAGNLQLSAPAKDYHPGQGTYRSAYKNALRMTRTETNLSYQTADNERWQQMDFVLGVRVMRSSLGDNYDCDICEAGVGDYPKDYQWDSFHPNCLCFAEPILAKDDDFDKYIESMWDDKEYQFTGQVQDVPDSFAQFQADHPNYVHMGH